jgi:ribosomal protein S15P/S13E
MVLLLEKKQEILATQQLHDKDTGSPEVQVAVLIS